MLLMRWQCFQCVMWAHLCAECFGGHQEEKPWSYSGAHSPLRDKACVQRHDRGKMVLSCVMQTGIQRKERPAKTRKEGARRKGIILTPGKYFLRARHCARFFPCFIPVTIQRGTSIVLI